jgi:hypothetical protein
MTKRIPIAEARRVAEAHGLTQVVLLGFDGERVHVVTYGATKEDCRQAALAQEFWSGSFDLGAPDPLHKARKLKAGMKE